MAGYGPAGYALFVAVYASLEILAIPAIPLTMSAGLLFGSIIGTIIVSISGATRNATGLVAPAIAVNLGALTYTLGTLVPVIGASGFATAAVATVVGTVVGSFR
ncbi:uncharacterized protein LOC114278839 [Camellia sinensis]|uniref:uncharacterized protein LOC114278839 n=1 Tax=Camellia sinensis TaxID=4442 RepID=UPI001035A95E|nr:uncharacterized protein LOC114278839 [Camellia sinensis]